MDKKVYMAPKMETIDIEVRSMLCLSDGAGSTPGSGDPISTDDPIEG